MGRYGLRIFHAMNPRTYPCQGMSFDTNNPEEPYWSNPPITAHMDNFVGWKNNRNGAIIETAGDVHFNNFKTADNILAGLEFSLTAGLIGEYAQINGAMIVGKTNNDDALLSASPRGIITPRTENFVVKNVNFYNFNWNEAAALGSCSHCFHPAATDEGGRTVKFSGLYFHSSVTRKIKYQIPLSAIYADLDGTLTGLGPNTWATSYSKRHMWDACTYLEEEYGGVICDSSVEVRTIIFNKYTPSGILNG